MIEFRVNGIPKGQPRPRAFARVVEGRAIVRVYEKGTAEAWKADVVLAGAPHRPPAPIQGAVRVAVDFFLRRPKRLMRRKDPEGALFATCKPDRDNLEKAVLDALTVDGWWRDDAQVVCGEVRKFYHAKEGRPGATITIEEIE